MDEINLKPYNPLRLRDSELRERHKKLILNKNVVGAADLIKNETDAGAFNASLFNSIEEKIVNIESLLNKMTPKQYTVYSETEPSESDMQGKFFWEQEY